MRTFLVAVCCVLVASAAHAAYLEDFEGYTPAASAPYDFNLTPEYGVSGWEVQYEYGNARVSTRIYNPAVSHPGYTGQGIYAGNQASGHARAVPAGLRAASTTVGVEGMFNIPITSNQNATLFLGSDCLVASGASATVADNSLGILVLRADGRGYFEYYHNGVGDTDVFQPTVGAGAWYEAGWIEMRLEIDLDGAARPTDLRGMWRLAGAATWIPLASGTFTTTGSTWTTTHSAFQPGQWNEFDNFVLTPEPATLAVLLIGGVLSLLARRRK